MKQWIAFLSILSLFCMMAAVSPVNAAAEEDAVVYRLAAAGDVHLRHQNNDAGRQRLERFFRYAYTYGNIDTFVLNGDNVNDGTLEQWQDFQDTVDAEIQGSSQYLLALARSHDIFNGDCNALDGSAKASFSAEEIQAHYTAIAALTAQHGNDLTANDSGAMLGNQVRFLDDCTIITLTSDLFSNDSFGVYAVTSNATGYERVKSWLKTQLDTATAADPAKPILLFCHYPEAGTLIGSQRWAVSSLRDLLSDYPQVIAFNAHAHRSPKDPQSIWQSGYTALYCGSVINNGIDAGYETETTVANDAGEFAIIEVRRSGTVTVRFCDVQSGAALTRTDFSGEELVYTIHPGDLAYNAEKRLAAARAPYFDNAATVLISAYNDTSATVSFDQATDRDLVTAYRLDLRLGDGAIVQTHTIGSDYYYEPMPERLSYTFTGLTEGTRYRLEITAINTWGYESETPLALYFTAGEAPEESVREPVRSVPMQINSAADFYQWLAEGAAVNAELTAEIELGRYAARINALLPLASFNRRLEGNGHVVNGGSGTLFTSVTGSVRNIGFTDLIVSPGCAVTGGYDADDFTAAEQASGAAAYALGWAQRAAGYPVSGTAVARITLNYPEKTEYVYYNVGETARLTADDGFAPAENNFTVTGDRTVTMNALSALEQAKQAYGALNSSSFADPGAFEAAVNDAVSVDGLKTAVQALALSESMAPEFRNHTLYEELFGTRSTWRLETRADLDALSVWSKENNGSGKTFCLTADIDMGNTPFGMIGTYNLPFRGTFDGQLHEVFNLRIDDRDSANGAGFFIRLQNTEVRNFGIRNGNVRGAVAEVMASQAGVGALCGRASGCTFKHCWNGADVSYYRYLVYVNACYGGLVGRSQDACVFVGCYNTGDVYGYQRASGISNWCQNGTAATRISNCFNIGRCYSALYGMDANSEAIGRYNGANASDNSYFSYNNYYLEGSAGTGINRSNYDAIEGAEESVALSAAEINTTLADLLNAARVTGLYTDTALWTQGENGYPVISTVDQIERFSDYTDASAVRNYTISSESELNAFAAASKTRNFDGYTFYLTAELDMSATENFAMIGGDAWFRGTFDGQGHTISNLTVSLDEANCGMFRRLQHGAVRNLTVSGANIAARGGCGVIAGLAYQGARIENVRVIGSALSASSGNGVAAIAGLGATNSSVAVISGCSVENTTITASSSLMVAGIVGDGKSVRIENCFAVDNNITGSARVGALMGSSRDTACAISGCYTYGNTLSGNNQGLANGYGQSAITVSGSVFCENIAVSGGGSTTQNGCYSTRGGMTETQCTSGEIAYAMGWSVDAGHLCFADASHAAARAVTYLAEESVFTTLYTDSAGATIGAPGTPEPPADQYFYCWEETAPDTYTAVFGTIPSFANFDALSGSTATFNIISEAELRDFSAASQSNSFSGFTFRLTRDLDLCDISFSPIGAFSGTFDGQGHTVTGLTVSGSSNVGFFSALAGGVVQNLTIKGANLAAAGNNAAILTASTSGDAVIRNVTIKSGSLTVTGSRMWAGGLIGMVANGSNTAVNGCTVSDTVITAEGTVGIGGAAGDLKAGQLSQTAVAGCTFTGNNRVGALVGSSRNAAGSVNGCYTRGNTLLSSSSGLAVGWAEQSIPVRNCVFCENAALVGKNSLAFSGCYSVYDGSMTEAQCASGEIAYTMGWSMENGAICFANASLAATRRISFTVNGAFYAYAYTDGGGAIIEAPADPVLSGYLFAGWSLCGADAYSADWEAHSPNHSVIGSLRGNIQMDIFLDTAFYLENEAGAYATITLPDQAGDFQTEKTRLTALPQGNDGRRQLTCDLTAGQMTDPITIRLYSAEGTLLEEIHYSIRQYLLGVVDYANNRDPANKEELIALCEATLRYGGYIQAFFGYHTDAPASAGINAISLDSATTDQKIAKSGSVEGLKLKSTSLLTLSESTVRHYFKLDEGADINNYTATLTFTGSTKPLVWRQQPGDARWYLEVEDIAAALLNDRYTITVRKDASAYTITYSAYCYIAAVLENKTDEALLTAVRALILYNEAADAYFEVS